MSNNIRAILLLILTSLNIGLGTLFATDNLFLTAAFLLGTAFMGVSLGMVMMLCAEEGEGEYYDE